MKKFLILALVGCGSLAAHADLSYTQTMAMNFGGMSLGAAGNSTSKMAMKGNLTRMENSIMGSKNIVIFNTGGTTTEINPSNKTYAVSSSTPKAPGGMPAGMKPSEITVTVKKLGMEKIRGVNAPHWMVSMLMKMNTAQGAQTMRAGMEIWSSTTPYPRISGASAYEKLPSNFAAMMGSKVKIKGDVKSMGAAYATVPLRTKILMNEQPMSTIETTDISTNTLPASLFSVPAGYKKVSDAQFQKAKQAAMMSKMGGMFKGMHMPR